MNERRTIHFEYMCRGSTGSFTDFILWTAREYFLEAHDLMRDWALPDISDLKFNKNRDNEDSMVAVYTKCFQIADEPEGAYGPVVNHVIRDDVSKYNPPHKETTAPHKTADNHPHRNPRQGRDIATSILDRILKYYCDYDSQYVAPYTFLVGPSGIGKTLAIEEMARQGMYVVHTSLAHLKSKRAYLRRSVIAVRIGSLFSKDHATQFFECFIAASLVNLRLCRRFGISPIRFFDIQTRNEFLSTQLDLEDRLIEFFKRVQDRSRKSRNSNYEYVCQIHINHLLPDYEREAETVFSQIHRDLKSEQSSDQYITDTVSEPNPDEKPLAIICFDEAQELFEVNLKLFKKDDKFIAFQRNVQPKVA